MVIAHQSGGVLAVRDLDQEGAADVRVFVDAAGFERPRVVNPSVDLEALVCVTERQVVDVRLELVDLCHGSAGIGRLICPSTSVCSIITVKWRGLWCSRNCSIRAGSDLPIVEPYQTEPNMRTPSMSIYEPLRCLSSQSTRLTGPSYYTGSG